jgi:Fur family ferric uptake transcriptional regulator
MTRPILSAVAPPTDDQRWTERALARLAAAGHRRGGARQELLRLLGEQHCALSALEIEQALATGRRVSRASIYRILEQLEEVGVIQRVEVGDGTTRFEPLREGPGHHHHLVCDSCGRLEPFSDEGLEQAIKRLSRRVPMQVSEHEVVLHGACRSCATPGC